MNFLKQCEATPGVKPGNSALPAHGGGLRAVEKWKFQRLHLIKPAGVSGSGEIFNDRIKS
jgi:hypothetical protein